MKCMICKVCFDTSEMLAQHMDDYPEEFECQYCELKTHYLYMLKKHIRSDHSDLLEKKD